MRALLCNRGQDSEQAETSHRSARMASVRSALTAESEVEDGREGAHSKSGSINEGSQGRKRGPLPSLDYSSLKKRKKVGNFHLSTHTPTHTHALTHARTTAQLVLVKKPERLFKIYSHG